MVRILRGGTEDVRAISPPSVPCAVFLKETATSDPLYNVYCKTNDAKELWESLETQVQEQKSWYKEIRGSSFMDYKGLIQRACHQVSDRQVLLHTFMLRQKNNTRMGQGMSEYLAPKTGIVKQNSKDCYNSDATGHRAAIARCRSRAKSTQANMAVQMDKSCIWATLATADIKGAGVVNFEDDIGKSSS
ncbi:hypothetical protein Tco_1256411 [Tanacetum coccineum]